MLDIKKKLEAEIAVLEYELRNELPREILKARAHGDLSENAEYHAAKERQGMIEAKIKDYEDKLSRAEIIDPSKLSGTKVRFGATVGLLNLTTDEGVTYRIVGAEEADLEQGTISISAPLARALIGKEIGDEVSVTLPVGIRKYEITSVEFV